MKNLKALLLIILINKFTFCAQSGCNFLIINEFCMDITCETAVDGGTNYRGDITLCIKAGSTFNYLKFTMIKDRLFYEVEHEESLIIENEGLVKDQWNKVYFTIFVREISFWPDQYSLKAIVNDLEVYIVDTNAWTAWSTIVSVLKTRVYIAGDAKISFSCLPEIATETSSTGLQDNAEIPKKANTLQGNTEIPKTATALKYNNEALKIATGLQDNAEVPRTVTVINDNTEVPITATDRQDNVEVPKTTDSKTSFATITKILTSSTDSLIRATDEDILSSNMLITPSFEIANNKTNYSSSDVVSKLETLHSEDSKVFWRAIPIMGKIYDVTLGFSLFVIIVGLCIFLPKLLFYFTMHHWYKAKLKNLDIDLRAIESINPENNENHYAEVNKVHLETNSSSLGKASSDLEGKLKKLGGTDLSNIESIDPKNKTNHYEEILKCGKTGKNETFYEELKVKPDVIKNIQWNIATDLKNSNMEREQDEDHSYDKPKSVKSETEETIYEELPEDFKALKNEK